MKKIFNYFISGLLLFFIVITILGHTEFGNKAIPSHLKGNHISINNEKIRVVQKGSGKDILLIHGTPGSLEDWNGLIDSLAKTFRITAFDRQGHGFSTKNNYSYHIEDNVVIVKKIIEKLKLRSPLLVGHSYGGSTLANFAINSKDTTLKYIIIDSPLYSYKADLTFRLLSIPIIGKGIALFSNYTIAEKQIENGIKFAFGHQTPENLDKLVKLRKNIWLQPKVLYSKSKESVNYQKDLNKMLEKYKTVEADITIITGKDENKTFRNDCEKFHHEVKNSKLIILEDTGHYIQFDQQQKVLDLIRLKME